MRRKYILFAKYVAIFLLIIFAGCRWSSVVLGYHLDIFDYGTYENVYKSSLHVTTFFADLLNADFQVKTMEPGYVFYSTLCKPFTFGHYNWYLLFTNCWLIILLYKGFRRNGIVYGFFFIFFYYVCRLYFQYNFVMMRQAMAMTIVWYGFKYVVEGNYRKYYLTILLASTFHLSAFVCLAFPQILKINISIKKYIVIISAIFILNVLHLTDFIIVNIVQLIVSFVHIDGLSRLLRYLMDERGLNLLSFVELIPFIYITCKYRDDFLAERQSAIFYRMFYFFLFVLVVTMNYGFLTRLCQYFMYANFYILSFYLNKKYFPENRVLLAILTVFLLVYSCRYILMWFYDTPYSCFLFN